MAELFIGLMSGTSADGIDAVLVDLAEPAPHVLAARCVPLAGSVRSRILALAAGTERELEEYAALDAELGLLFAEAARAVLTEAGVSAEDVRAVGCHGQTIRHYPRALHPTSLQIGDPNVIATRTGVTTVADFRRADIAAGGEGAPLVPAFHAAVFRAVDRTRVVLNIGGIANITILPRASAGAVRGFDTGPGNVLLDTWAAQHLNAAYDVGGRWAATGTVEQALLTALLDDPYFRRPPPKSTGREHFNLPWLSGFLHACGPCRPEAVQATLCELTAATVAQAIAQHAPDTAEVLVCGGGAHNRTLLQRLRTRLGAIVCRSTAELGLPPDWVEAVAFAWLAKRTLEGRSGNLPTVTGAKRAVVLGGVYNKQGRGSEERGVMGDERRVNG